MKIALIDKANTSNIIIVNNGNYRLTLPDGSQVSPVFAGWENETWKLCDIVFDEPRPTYVESVDIGSAAGNGYTANDILTISGGTSVGNTAQVQVFTIGSNGVVTSLIVANSGFYTENPEANNVPTGGTGSGVRVNLNMRDHDVAFKTYSYNSSNNNVSEINSYAITEIDNTISIEMQRQKSINADSNNQNLKDKLKNASAAQIDNWLQNNVTDLASARTVLGAIIKLLANKYPYGSKS